MNKRLVAKDLIPMKTGQEVVIVESIHEFVNLNKDILK